MNFNAIYDNYLAVINDALRGFLLNESIPPNLRAAMNYSVFAGGKRLRPILFLATCDMLGFDYSKYLRIPCAIELIHTYSLIHDDLPAIDNDDLRRGMPTSHKKYGEAQAILAGDALLSYAFQIMLDQPDGDSHYFYAVKLVADRAGAGGMVAGQCADLGLDMAEAPDVQRVSYIHAHKTADMIIAPVLSAAIISGQDTQTQKRLELYAKNLGLAFQICDDCLDVTGNQDDMGKTLGKDEIAGKLTFPVLYGLDESIKMATELTCAAMDSIAEFGEKGMFLCELARTSLLRNK